MRPLRTCNGGVFRGVFHTGNFFSFGLPHDLPEHYEAPRNGSASKAALNDLLSFLDIRS